jgi:molybdopterin-binding protein
MQVSARNQLKGTITRVTPGAVMSEVIVTIGGGQEVVALITIGSVERMKLKPGDSVTVIVKSTDVIIGK